MHSKAAGLNQPIKYLQAEPSLPDFFKGQAKLLYVKKENQSLGQKLKDFILQPLMIVVAKASLITALKADAFKNNPETTKFIAHIKQLSFFEGVDECKVNDFLVGAALRGSRLNSASDTTNKAEKSLGELTDTALNEYLTHPGHMYITLQQNLDDDVIGLEEFHHFQKDPNSKLNESQITNINKLKQHVDELKSDSEKSKFIPAEVFIKFSEIYTDFSKRCKAKDLILSTWNLIDRLSVLPSKSEALDCFLAFFQEKNIFMKEVYVPLATLFKKDLEDLKLKLDPYGVDIGLRATLDVLADEFLAHANHPEQAWSIAEEIKLLKREQQNNKEALRTDFVF